MRIKKSSKKAKNLFFLNFLGVALGLMISRSMPIIPAPFIIGFSIVFLLMGMGLLVGMVIEFIIEIIILNNEKLKLVDEFELGFILILAGFILFFVWVYYFMCLPGDLSLKMCIDFVGNGFKIEGGQNFNE